MQDNPIVVAAEHNVSMRAVKFFFELRSLGMMSGFATIYDKNAPTRYVRTTAEHNYSKDVKYLGDDPKGRDCIIIEDFIGATKRLLDAVNLLKEKGAHNVYVASTHGMLMPSNQTAIDRSPIKEVVLTNTINLKRKSAKIMQLSVALYLAEVIKAIEEKRHQPITEIVYSDTFEE
eukprot:TRINITY_DN4544_c0_g4_i2.p1 TRINITY_DN4544_c0_g4~~TRINITY_DN4544_c0_g4_i2.p1  ORF type:complete len:175 (+),score=32.39 TRINITY_DN4544_c0_g4_i2:995-1519(+)